MKKIGTLFIMLVILAACGGKKEGAETANILLTPQEFQDKFKPEAVIIDVRTPEEFTSGNLPNSLNIDFKNPEFEQNISLLDKEKTYLVYCASGVRSGKAANLMIEKGFKSVYALDGGLNAWQKAGMPMN
ncbi:MAG: rhodanese-like domain-containing protein [Bacteroidota bacterium]